MNRHPAIEALAEGVEHLNKGRNAEARDAFQRALEAAPGNPDALSYLGFAEAALGEIDSGLEKARKALAADPGHFQYRCNLAFVLSEAGQKDAAISELQRARELQPGHPAVLDNLGRLLQEQGRFEDAVPVWRELYQQNRGNPRAIKQVVSSLIQAGEPEQAYRFVKSIENELPEGGFRLMMLALAAQTTMRWKEAADCFEKLVELQPDNPEFRYGLGQALVELEEFERAVPVVKDLAKDHPTPENLFLAARALFKLQQHDRAKALLEQALEKQPNHPGALVKFGFIHVFAGEQQKAKAMFERALELDPYNVEAITQLHKIAPPKRRNVYFDRLERLKNIEGRQVDAVVGQALGQLYEAIKEYDLAFENFTVAKRATAEEYAEMGAVNDPEAVEARFKQLKEIFSKANLEAVTFPGSDKKTPIFIFGMPRSGTTLLEQIIASHSRVAGGGELAGGPKLVEAVEEILEKGEAQNLAGILDEYGEAWVKSYLTSMPERAAGEDRVTDKMPNNFLGFGLLRALFPRARFVHIRRHPMDTCVSMFTKRFKHTFPYATDLYTLGHYYRHYLALMDHWRKILGESFHEVIYEDLVDDPEGIAKGVFSYLGLAWDPQCLEFYRRKGKVATMSTYQVRQPINKSSIGRWRNYRKHLAPLRKGLGGEILAEWEKRERARGAT